MTEYRYHQVEIPGVVLTMFGYIHLELEKVSANLVSLRTRQNRMKAI